MPNVNGVCLKQPRAFVASMPCFIVVYMILYAQVMLDSLAGRPLVTSSFVDSLTILHQKYSMAAQYFG